MDFFSGYWRERGNVSQWLRMGEYLEVKNNIFYNYHYKKLYWHTYPMKRGVVTERL